MEVTEFFVSIKSLATIIHVFGAVIGMGGALIADVLFSFFAKDKKLNNTEITTLEILSKIVLVGLAIIVISGIAIFLSDPDKYLNSAKFLSKMTIIFILMVNGFVLNKYIWPHLLRKNFFTLKNERSIRKLAFACGVISVISWLSAFTLASLAKLNMTYTNIMSLYVLIVIVGVTLAILIEKKEFN